jgi:hypothetical protein
MSVTLHLRRFITAERGQDNKYLRLGGPHSRIRRFGEKKFVLSLWELKLAEGINHK